MKVIAALKSVSGVSPANVAQSSLVHKSFNSVLQGVAGGSGSFIELQKDISRFSQKVLTGVELKPRELIIYQIKAGQFGLGVELVSKVGESLSTTIKRLKQGH